MKVIDNRLNPNYIGAADFTVLGSTYTDENFLHNYFHWYLHTMYGTDFIKNMICDGFEEKLDPDFLPPIIHALAERLGYFLKDGMWQEYDS